MKTTALYDVAGQVQEVRGHVDDVAQQAVLLLVVGHPPLALLALVPRVAALAQALVGLHADAAVAAGRLTLGCGRRDRTRGGEAARVSSGVLCALGFRWSDEGLLLKIWHIRSKHPSFHVTMTLQSGIFQV